MTDIDHRGWWHRLTCPVCREREAAMWETTGQVRTFWDQGGCVSLEGAQRHRGTGKVRWRTADWLPDYSARLRKQLAKENEEYEVRRRAKAARRAEVHDALRRAS